MDWSEIKILGRWSCLSLNEKGWLLMDENMMTISFTMLEYLSYLVLRAP